MTYNTPSVFKAASVASKVQSGTSKGDTTCRDHNNGSEATSTGAYEIDE